MDGGKPFPEGGCPPVIQHVRLNPYGDCPAGRKHPILRDLPAPTQESRLPSSAKHLQAIFNQAPIGMFRSTVQGRFLEANPAAAAMLGYDDPEDLIAIVNEKGIGQTLFADPAKRVAFVAEMQDRTEAWHVMEVSYLKKNGEALDAILSICLQHDPEIGAKAFFGFIQDITERKRQEAHRQHTEKLLALGTLASGIAHDFNNLLAGILGYSDLMTTESDPGRLQTLATRLHKVVVKAQGFTSGLLRFSRQGLQEATRFDAHELIRNALYLFEPVRPGGVQVHLALTAPQATLQGFPDHFQNAVLNLCLNARDAMPEGGSLSLRTCEAEPPAGAEPMPAGPCLCLEIQDTGLGMSAETLKRCLDPFFTTKTDGTGLGLPSVRSTVADLGGVMTIHSQPGEGTRFRLFLPLAEPPPCA